MYAFMKLFVIPHDKPCSKPVLLILNNSSFGGVLQSYRISVKRVSIKYQSTNSNPTAVKCVIETILVILLADTRF